MKKIELDQFCHISYVGGLSSSPNEDKLCFVKSMASAENNCYESNLWLYSLEKGYTQLTFTGKDRHPKWLDNDHIAFVSTRMKDEKIQKNRIYKLPVTGGEAQLLLETFLEIQSYEILDADHWLIHLRMTPQRTPLEQEGDLDALLHFDEKHGAYEILDEIPFWSNGEGFTNKKRSALGILNIHTKKMELLTDGLTDVYDFTLSSDKTKLVYIYNSFRNVMSFFNGLGYYNLITKERRDISHVDEFTYENCQFDAQDHLIVFGKPCTHFGLNENGKFYIYDDSLSPASCKCISNEFDNGFGSSVGSDVKYGAGNNVKWLHVENKLIFPATVGYNCNLYALENDQVIPYTEIEGAVFGFSRLNGGIIFNALKDGKPMELYFLKDGVVKQLSHFNVAYGTDIFFSAPEHFVFESFDGTPLDGWIIKPAHFNEGRRYPTILNIHGGPKTVYGSVYYHEMQYWASEGFVVIYCNPRGSDGKGNTFADIRGNYGTSDYQDLMCFVDHVIERYPFVNHDQMGVTGGSYGGFMTNWIIGHTHRFKAAATQRSISNWISKYGTTDIGYFFVEDQMGTTPWKDVEKLWAQSPLKYADQIKTPTLVIHSDEDYRCWLAEGLQMFTALKVNGVPSRMLILKGENHELSRSGKPQNRMTRLQEITDWMKKYLMVSTRD